MALALELKQVSKAFLLRHNPALSLKVRLIGLMHARHRERPERFWALSDVSLAIEPGECLGLIGPNGSGKSTLLRLMASIFPPTTGEVLVRGRVAPMIELGVGFHPDLTGRENVYLSTSLYGLSRRETDGLYPRIVAFSELGDFMDLPVKNYSMGMYVRLGFSVAVHLDAGILLIDEVLAVGDEPFQLKCLERMMEFRRRGTTVILVSHNTEIMRGLCDRVCVLVGGRIHVDDTPAHAIERYRELLAAAPRAAAAEPPARR